MHDNAAGQAKAANIRRIAIIGGGPTGIVCAKFLLAEKCFDTINIFEQRSDVGGVWNLSSNDRSSRINIPQTNPRYGISDETAESLEFESPLYDYLETNIPKTMMNFSEKPFDDNLPLYPGHLDVLHYLQEYADPVRHLLKLDTQVIDLHLMSPDCERTTLDQKWSLTSRHLPTGTESTAKYDAVVIANGHYTVPHVPAISGVEQWNERYPNRIIHAKAYRRPEDFTDRRVVVIGNSASGVDIASQLAPYAKSPILLASRSASQFVTRGQGPEWRADIAEIEQFLDTTHNRAVRTKTGQIVDEIDTVVFATGYYYSYPFLNLAKHDRSESNVPTPSEASDSSDVPSDTASINDKEALSQDHSNLHHGNFRNVDGITSSGLRTHHVFKHFLHIDYPTLAIPVLNLKIIPFPLAANQSAILARLWSGRLQLPTQQEMLLWETEEEMRLLTANRLRPAPMTGVADGSSIDQNSKTHEAGFHTMAYPEDIRQINTLYDWALQASPRGDLENSGLGKLGTRRDEYQTWLRGKFADIKAAYTRLGQQKTKITSLEMLGDEWKDAFDRWSRTTSQEEQSKLFAAAGVHGW